MNSDATIARSLAATFVDGPWEVESLVERGGQLLGKRYRWLRPLARRVTGTFANGPRPPQARVATFIARDEGFRRACDKYALCLQNPIGIQAAMCPIPDASSWNVPSICTVAELADWLGISLSQLEWFADLRSLQYKRDQGRHRHYHYRPLTKRFGRVRLIEAPKLQLKLVQRCILEGILDQIPAHDAAHGFRRGRSIKTFAAGHVSRDVVIRMDLNDFFPSVSLARVQAVFRSVGYPCRVADVMAGLCTNRTPSDVWNDEALHSRTMRAMADRYSQPHLPQGAPTSPALANLCAYRLDCRLTALAGSADAIYTRYADDLAFSGGEEFARSTRRFYLHVSAIVMEEGFSVHYRKTRIMRQGVRQQLAGIVVNQHANVPRADYDRLKATLVNSIRHGPESQNRSCHDDFRSHLNGRVSFVEMLNPSRGKKLRELFDRIEWSAE